MRTIDELMEIIPAPDFPTAGIIYGLVGSARWLSHRPRPRGDARQGSLRGHRQRSRQSIIVDEIPYQVNKKTCWTYRRAGQREKIEGIVTSRDESDKSGMRVVIDLKRGEARWC
jgi:DNA gyrase subunit A